LKHEFSEGKNNGHIKRETRGKRKVDDNRLTGQHKVELKNEKDGWDITLNAPTRDDKASIMASMKPSQMH
jgi:hypothetical protein